jgi:hypothetical protein
MVKVEGVHATQTSASAQVPVVVDDDTVMNETALTTTQRAEQRAMYCTLCVLETATINVAPLLPIDVHALTQRATAAEAAALSDSTFADGLLATDDDTAALVTAAVRALADAQIVTLSSLADAGAAAPIVVVTAADTHAATKKRAAMDEARATHEASAEWNARLNDATQTGSGSGIDDDGGFDVEATKRAKIADDEGAAVRAKAIDVLINAATAKEKQVGKHKQNINL